MYSHRFIRVYLKGSLSASVNVRSFYAEGRGKGGAKEFDFQNAVHFEGKMSNLLNIFQ